MAEHMYRISVSLSLMGKILFVDNGGQQYIHYSRLSVE